MKTDWFDKLWQNIINNKSEEEISELIVLNSIINKLNKENIINQHHTHTIKEEYKTLLNKYELLKESVKEHIIDINDYKKYYENKKESSPWKYPFKGDGKYKDVKYALRDNAEEEKELRTAANELITKYKLTIYHEPEDIIEAIIKYFRIKKHWRYLNDEENKTQGNKRDYWQKAGVSWKNRVGDCEDLAILMHNIIYYIFDDLQMSSEYWRLEFSAWVLIGNEGGHAQNTWLGNDGEYYIIETTYDLKGSFSRTWLKTPIRYNNLYSKPLGWARKDCSWRGSLSSLENMTLIK